MNNFGLPADILADIIKTLRNYPEIKSAKVFGSRAKGSFKRYSDVDIAIFADKSHSLAKHIKYDLEELDTIYNFDVLDYNTLSNVEIKAHIDRVGTEIYIA